MRHSCIASSRRRCSMARRRASMREGPLAELFKATEAAQKQAEARGETPAEAAAESDAPAQQTIEDTVVATPPAPEIPTEPEERTVEHVPSWEEEAAAEA